MYDLFHGDCTEVMAGFPDNSFDSIVTDPPYGLNRHSTPEVSKCLSAWVSGNPYLPKGSGFMGKQWDAWVPGPEVWGECLRVLKPGGYILVFAGTRSQDLMGIALRLAGFEVVDTLMWVYASGFPKGVNIGKAMDRKLGAEREVTGRYTPPDGGVWNLRQADGGGSGHSRGAFTSSGTRTLDITSPATPEAEKWEGWNTSLKPAYEPVIMCRKPLDGTFADNTLKWGCGGINVDGCRIGEDTVHVSGKGSFSERQKTTKGFTQNTEGVNTVHQGRFPSNFIHDGSDEVTRLFPDSRGQSGDVKGTENSFTGAEGTSCYGQYGRVPFKKRGGSGSASRFFFCAKTSAKDRNSGLGDFPCGEPPASARSLPAEGRENALGKPRQNFHPTVKPTELMKYLVRLVTPKGGRVLDPFMGSGSTGKACMKEGMHFTGIEKEEQYFQIAEARIKDAVEFTMPDLGFCNDCKN